MKREQTTGLLSGYLENTRIEQVVKLIDNKATILDVGCGRAALLTKLNKTGKQVRYTGLDILDDQLAINRDLHQGQQFIKFNIVKDPITSLPAVKYDTITMIAVIEHFDQPEQILNKVMLFLKPHGKIILTTPRRGSESIYAIGAKAGLFSREALEEHRNKFLDYADMVRLSAKTGLNMSLYKKFLFGFNQLIVLSK